MAGKRCPTPDPAPELWKTMFDRLKNWLRPRDDDDDSTPPARASALSRSGAFSRTAATRPAVQAVRPASAQQPASRKSTRVRSGNIGEIMDLGPGKNVLVRDGGQLDESGTDELLQLIDDAGRPANEETGIDPYNTGKFDRSKNWDKRFR
jgi:hypothetical protein